VRTIKTIGSVVCATLLTTIIAVNADAATVQHPGWQPKESSQMIVWGFTCPANSQPEGYLWDQFDSTFKSCTVNDFFPEMLLYVTLMLQIDGDSASEKLLLILAADSIEYQINRLTDVPLCTFVVKKINDKLTTIFTFSFPTCQSRDWFIGTLSKNRQNKYDVRQTY
jgi:hypothetical protein